MPVNTFSAVRSESCVYLAGITFGPASCCPSLCIVIKRSGAELVLYTSSLSPPPNTWAEAECFAWRLVSLSAHLSHSLLEMPFSFFLMKRCTVYGAQTPPPLHPKANSKECSLLLLFIFPLCKGKSFLAILLKCVDLKLLLASEMLDRKAEKIYILRVSASILTF